MMDLRKWLQAAKRSEAQAQRGYTQTGRAVYLELAQQANEEIRRCEALLANRP